MGFYTDRIDYTFKYKTSDAGRPFSVNEDNSEIILSVEEGEPYDIKILK